MKTLTSFTVMFFLSIIPVYAGQKAIGLSVSQGKFRAYISLGWNKVDGYSQYEIYRAPKKWGPYKKIASFNKTWYMDTDVEPGLVYWYRIRGRYYFRYTSFSNPQSGYRYIPEPKGDSLGRLVRAHNRKMPRLSPYGRKQISIIKKFYSNFIQLSFVLFLARPYIKDNRITLITDYDYVVVNKKSGQFYFREGNRYVVKMYSLSLKGIHDICLKHDHAGKDLFFNKLMRNAVFYTMFKGNRPFKTGNGRIIMLPYYEALGLTTEYYGKNKDWRFNTILLGTSNPTLRNEMMNVKKGRKPRRY